MPPLQGQIIQGRREPWVIRDLDLSVQTDPAKLIHRHWVMLGGAPGEPVSQIERVGPGSRIRYQHGSIYIIGTDMRTTHYVYGGIATRYDEIGGAESWLGFPTSEEKDFVDGGRIQTFQHGDIYWWRDVGAIELNEVVVNYAGLICYAETDNDLLSAADEPYVVLGVVAPGADLATRTPIYEGVDAGEGRPGLIELYRGKPNGIVLSALLLEHDDENPDRYKAAMASAVGAAATGITGAIAATGGGVPIAAIVGPLLGALVPVITEQLNTLLDLHDDTLGQQDKTLTAKELVVLAARTQNSTKHGVEYKVETPSFTREGSEYRVYYGVVPG
jgi:LGFP repeat